MCHLNLNLNHVNLNLNHAPAFATKDGLLRAGDGADLSAPEPDT